MSKQKIYIALVVLLTLSFTTKALASLTFSTNALTGTTPSTIDVGAGNTLSLQTTNNGNTVFGAGNVGIGTGATTPVAPLTIIASTPVAEALRISTTSTVNPASFMYFTCASTACNGDSTHGLMIGLQARAIEAGANYANASWIRAAGPTSEDIDIEAGLGATANRGILYLQSIGGLTYLGGNVAVGGPTGNKLSLLTIVQPPDAANIGGTTTANASTTITGVGTKFLTSVGIGDRISLSSSAATYATITAIASDTSLTVSSALGNGTSQTINLKKSMFRIDDNTTATKLIVNDQGNVGIGTTTPVAPLMITASTPNEEVLRISSVGVNNNPFMYFTDVTGGTTTHGLMIGFQERAVDAGVNYANASYIRAAGSVSQNIDLQAGLDNSLNQGNIDLQPFGGNTHIGSGGTGNRFSLLTITQPPDAANIGGTSTANASTTITGVGTTFLSSVGLGDRISLSSSAATYATVTAIASDTSLTVSSALGNGTSQTVNLKKSMFRIDNNTPATQLIFNDQGNLGLGTLTPGAKLDINSNSFILETAQTPASSSAACTTGMISWDTGFVYVCTATNTWKRAAIATW